MSISERIIENMVSSLMDTKDDEKASLDKLYYFQEEVNKIQDFIFKQTKFYDDKKDIS